MVATDPHPIAKHRVMGPSSNLPEFQKAWSCRPDAAMVRAEGKRCNVWQGIPRAIRYSFGSQRPIAIHTPPQSDCSS